jgi:predicted AAA+ superfamily ATPase
MAEQPGRSRLIGEGRNVKTIYESCVPRDEVFKGELREQQFAASLTKVLRGQADPIYGDAETFFANTYATGGLKALLREALGRVGGKIPTGAPVIRLETSFGGGKTHNLIALHHLCKGGLSAKLAARFVSPELLPERPVEKVAGIVGPDMEVADGIDHGGLRTYTLWGEIAYQIGREAGYEVVRKSDEQRTAPGTQVWEKLIGDEPALIMIDEIGYYLRVARGAQAQVGSTSLAEQTVAFLMSLIKFVAESKRCVLVYTLTDVADAFGKEAEDLRQELAEARSVSSRQEHILTPTAEDEISAIVSHRMFQKVDRTDAEMAAEEFVRHYAKLIEQGADLPQRATRPEYKAEIVQDYPFHPELLTTLNRKTSTIPNFQKTRGVLRLLAQTIRDLWEPKNRLKDCYLIGPSQLNLGDDQLANDLTSRLDRPQFKQVIEADIASPRAGTLSHAQEVDRDWTEAGKPPYARRVATTAFLHSLVQTGQSGVEAGDLRLAVIQPGDDPALIDKAMQRLLDRCWFLDYDGLRYRFKTEASLRKIVDDEMGLVGKVKAKSELDDRIKKVWKKGIFSPAFFPAEAVEVDDDALAPKLAVIHYDAAAVKATQPTPPPDLVLKLFEHKGSLEEYRTYKNNVVFLVADADQVDRMIEVAQRYLAVHRIISDQDRLAEFNKDQIAKLKKMSEAAELDLRVAVTKAYRHLYYPSADAPRKSGNLAHHLLQPGDQGDVEADQTAVVLRVLKSLDKVLTADDNPLNAQYLKAKAWPPNTPSLSTEDLRKAFAQRLGLRMLLDINQLKKSIKDGVAKGVWVYYPSDEGVGYGTPSPAPLIEIGENATLYTPEEAQRVGVKIKGAEPVVETCPVCQKSPCVCGEDDEDEGGAKAVSRVQFEGTPAQAFQAIADQCHDHQIGALKRLFIRVEGPGKNAANAARSLGLAIPQMGKASLALEQKMVLEFGGGESFTVNFTGSWDRYKRIKSLTDALSQEASSANIKLVLRAEFESGLAVGGDQFQTIRDVLESLGTGKIAVEGVPASKEAADGQ